MNSVVPTTRRNKLLPINNVPFSRSQQSQIPALLIFTKYEVESFGKFTRKRCRYVPPPQPYICSRAAESCCFVALKL